MAWIPAPKPPDCPPETSEILRSHEDPSTGEVDEILRVHALDRGGLEAHLAVYLSAMEGTRSLRKVDRELVAFIVSQLNGCHY